jgi:MFS superfamily sulfate permease-like transporter
MDKKHSKKHGNFYNLRDILAATTVGSVSFPFALGFVQNFVFKPLRISCELPNTIVALRGSTSHHSIGYLCFGRFCAVV